MNKNMIKIFCAIVLLVSVFGFTTAGRAASYDLKEITPEVRRALDNRRGRFDQLAAMKQAGKVGETNNGYVKALVGEGDVQKLVADENNDRKFIYQEIASQNNLPDGSLATIEQVFAEVQRQKASSGEKIQLPDGSWSNK